MKRYITIILTILLFCGVGRVRAQKQELSFHTLTPENGLSQNSVNSIYQDEQGAIWVGTRDGLNRYDGGKVSVFRLEKNNPNSLFCNNVLEVHGDGAGSLYLLCRDGVAMMDMRNEHFTTLMQGRITTLYWDEVLYVGRGAEILEYDTRSGELKQLYTLPSQSSVITAIHCDKLNRLWDGTDGDGIFTIENNALNHIIKRGKTTNIFEDIDGCVWVGSWDSGLYKFKSDGEWINFRHNPADNNSLPSDFVRSCCQDNDGNLWIGTFLGLSKYNPINRKFTTYRTALTNMSIWSTIKDRQGSIWIGTYFGGVNWFNPQYSIYTQYNTSKEPNKGLSFSVVGKITEDAQERLWICTEGGGVTLYDKKNDSFEWFVHDPNRNSLSHNNVKAVYYDTPTNTIYFGTHLGGMSQLNISTGQFTNYLHDPQNPHSIPSNIVRDIVRYGDKLYVATFNGLATFDLRSKQFKSVWLGRSVTIIPDILIDSQDRLWVACEGDGLFLYDLKSGKINHLTHDASNQKSLSSNNITSIVEDFKGNIWFAHAGTGIDRYRPETGDFDNYDKHSAGLGGNFIYELCDNRDGTLSVTSNAGFSILVPSARESLNYSIENGFPISSPNENAMFMAADRTLYVGGVDGLVSFRKDDLLSLPKKGYDIVFTDLYVDAELIRAGDDTKILSQRLNYTSQISLHSRYNAFRVDFSTSNYIFENNDPIEYRLVGFSPDWTQTTSRSITYTNISAGNYELQIRSVGNNPNVVHANLSIQILPPWYNTILAWIVYILAAVTIIYALLRNYYGRVRLNEQVKYEQNRIADIEELNRSKLRFFTNISHEFRTPLTLITGQIEMLLHSDALPQNIYSRLLNTHKSSLQLNVLINELLDFRKQEQGHMKLRVSEGDVIQLLDECFQMFVEHLTNRDIELRWEHSQSSLLLIFDPLQLRKVFVNLLSNAAKHTPKGGVIRLSVEEDTTSVTLSVSDSGVGVAPEEHQRIFERFYQSTVSDTSSLYGTGIGLALAKGIVELHGGKIWVDSELGEGACFCVRLLKGDAHLLEDAHIVSSGTQLSDNAESNLPILSVETSDYNSDVRSIDAPNAELIDRVRGAKILIVEDDDALREMLRDVFSSIYEVDAVCDGVQAMERVKSQMPQIILSDVMMPNMSGIELCQAIKGNAPTCHIPFVLLTARTTTEYTIEGLNIGADDYIAKPFNVELLLARCNNLVNSRKILQERYSNQPAEDTYKIASNEMDRKMLERALAIVERYIDDVDFNISTFSSEIGLSRTNLFNKIKAISGLTPNDFVLTVRLKRSATMLLKNPELSIMQISEATGFNTPRYFSKCFKDSFGVTPNDYRSGKRTTKKG